MKFILNPQLAARAQDGEANKCLIAFLSPILNVPKSNIQILSGQTSRYKKIGILGVSESQAIEKLNASSL